MVSLQKGTPAKRYGSLVVVWYILRLRPWKRFSVHVPSSLGDLIDEEELCQAFAKANDLYPSFTLRPRMVATW